MTFQEKIQRPRGITIITIWSVLEGIYYFYTQSIGMFGGKSIFDIFVGSPLEDSLAIYGLGFGLFHFVVAWGFWYGKPWIRIPTIIVISSSVIVTWVLFSFQMETVFRSIFSTVLVGIVVIYLFKSNVKTYFEKYKSEPQ